MTVLRFGTETGHVTQGAEPRPASVGGGSSQRVTTLELTCEARVRVGFLGRVRGDRMRLQTSRRLEPVFGVAPRPSRIDTLKCREAKRRRVFGRRGSRPSKHMRGGRKPNGWIGKPRRGKRS
jgi:hypothetical protein